jgi:uncharacterized phage protein (TIGR01671 family)
MRELKFRAWDSYHKEFILDAQATYDNQCRGKGSINHESFQEVLEDENCIIEQFTGLKDKNGKEIYEGDIVKYSYKMDARDKRLLYSSEVVEFDTIEEEEWPNSTISGFILHNSEDGYEVIGNIHENPELLEGMNVLSKEEE